MSELLDKLKQRKPYEEMSFIEVGELVLEAAGNWRGAAIIELSQEQWGLYASSKEILWQSLNALWWGVEPETIIDELLQGLRWFDNSEIPF